MNRFRTLTGTIIAAMLLIMSCGSARCEAACDSESFRPACHSEQPASHAEQHAMSGMRDCGMQAANEPSGASFQMAHSQCLHQVCKQDVAVFQSEKHFQADKHQLRVFGAVLSLGMRLQRSSHIQLARGNLPPPLRSISPLQMSSILRI